MHEQQHAGVVDSARRVMPRILSRDEEEHHRIASQIHDGLGQAMTALRLRLALLDTSPEIQSAENKMHLRAAISMVDAAIDDMRILSHALYPSALNAAGLSQALSDLCLRTADVARIRVTFHGSLAEQIPAYLKVLLYRLAQQALNTAARAKETLQISMRLEQDAETIRLLVHIVLLPDSQEAVRQLYRGISPCVEEARDTIEALGGGLKLESERGSLLSLNAVIPLPEEL